VAGAASKHKREKSAGRKEVGRGDQLQKNTKKKKREQRSGVSGKRSKNFVRHPGYESEKKKKAITYCRLGKTTSTKKVNRSSSSSNSSKWCDGTIKQEGNGERFNTRGGEEKVHSPCRKPADRFAGANISDSAGMERKKERRPARQIERGQSREE